MIPLRDHNKSATFPFVTYAFIAANIAVAIYMFMLPEAALDRFVLTYALIPAEIVRGIDLMTLVTSMFLHGGLGHIIGNMLFLNIFGDNLEDRMGHMTYALFYLLCGLAASALQIWVDPTETIPNLGASGAIAGLMGGYLVLFPRHQVDILVPVWGFLQHATVPAYTMLIYWIIFQFVGGFGSWGSSGQGGVAYFAHIGGFLAGLLLVRLFARRRAYFIQ